MLQLVVYGIIVLSSVVGATLLGYNGSISEAAITAIYGAAIGFAGGAGIGASSLYTVINGKSLVSPQYLAEQGASTRTAIVAAAAGDARTVQPVEPTQHAPEE